MLQTPQRAARSIPLPKTVVIKAAKLASIPSSDLLGFHVDTRRLLADFVFVGDPVDREIASLIARDLADVRRDVLRVCRRLMRHRNLVAQTDLSSERDLVAALAGRALLGPRVATVVSELGDIAEHIKKQIEVITGQPHKKGRQRGAHGNPALSDLIFELEFTALHHMGRGYGLGHAEGTGSLIDLLNALKEVMPEGFIPESHPISSYQDALNRARDAYWEARTPDRDQYYEWLYERLKAEFDRVIY